MRKTWRPRGRIAGFVEHPGELVDYFLPVGVAGGQQFGGSLAQLGRAMCQQLPTAGGVESAGWYRAIVHAIQQRGDPSVATEQHVDCVGHDGRTVRRPVNQQGLGDAVIARSSQSFDGRVLNGGGLLRLEQRGQHGKILRAIVGEAEHGDGRRAVAFIERIVGSGGSSGRADAIQLRDRIRSEDFGEWPTLMAPLVERRGNGRELPRGETALLGRGGCRKALGDGLLGTDCGGDRQQLADCMRIGSLGGKGLGQGGRHIFAVHRAERRSRQIGIGGMTNHQFA